LGVAEDTDQGLALPAVPGTCIVPAPGDHAPQRAPDTGLAALNSLSIQHGQRKCNSSDGGCDGSIRDGEPPAFEIKFSLSCVANMLRILSCVADLSPSASRRAMLVLDFDLGWAMNNPRSESER